MALIVCFCTVSISCSQRSKVEGPRLKVNNTPQPQCLEKFMPPSSFWKPMCPTAERSQGAQPLELITPPNPSAYGHGTAECHTTTTSRLTTSALQSFGPGRGPSVFSFVVRPVDVRPSFLVVRAFQKTQSFSKKRSDTAKRINI